MAKKPQFFIDNHIIINELDEATALPYLPKLQKVKKRETKTVSFECHSHLKWSCLLKDEKTYQLLFEHTFWKNGVPTCPGCGAVGKYYLINSGEAGRHKLQRYKCKICGRKFSVKTDTFMHKSKLSLEQWFWVVYYLVFSNLEITPTELMKEVVLSQQSAFFAMSRLINSLDTKTYFTNLLNSELDFKVDELLKQNTEITAAEVVENVIGHHKHKSLPDKPVYEDYFATHTELIIEEIRKDKTDER